jgi:hypothetical protein
MSERVEEAVHRYCEHISKQIARIQAISGESADLFKKVLFCSVLDVLSRSIYPRKKPRDRFTSLVRRFGRWSHQDRVSLPHLARVLQLCPDPAFEKLRAFSNQKLATWKAPWGSIKLDQDPTEDDVSAHWPRNNEYKVPIEGVRIKSLTHLQLLYSHRNSLVHELRSPGYGMDLGDETEPFYHDMSTISSSDEPPIETIELVYPVKFFEQLCSSVLTELRKYLLTNELNPYDYYRFGSYWIEGLN